MKNRFMLATGLGENLTQVVFRQPFVIQHVRTRSLNCENWNFSCFDVFVSSSKWNQCV